MTTASRSGGFEGDLHALSVVEIVQTLSLANRTARILLRSGAKTGELWLEDGALTHAIAGSLYGELAVYAMIEWTAGRFQVEYGATCDCRSISGDTTYLLLDGLRRADEKSSTSTPPIGLAEVLPVSEAGVRRQRARRIVLGGSAFVLVAGAIAAASFRRAEPPERVAPSVAAPVAVPDTAPRRAAARVTPAPKRSVPAPSTRSETSSPAPRPVFTTPDSPLAEEPVPYLPSNAAEAAASDVSSAPASAPASRVRISLHCGSGGGSLTVLVDGEPIFQRDRLDGSAAPETEITVSAGDHLIVARLDGGPQPGVHEASIRGSFAGGETRQLHISANRIFGSPVKLKLV